MVIQTVSNQFGEVVHGKQQIDNVESCARFLIGSVVGGEKLPGNWRERRQHRRALTELRERAAVRSETLATLFAKDEQDDYPFRLDVQESELMRIAARRMLRAPIVRPFSVADGSLPSEVFPVKSVADKQSALDLLGAIAASA